MVTRDKFDFVSIHYPFNKPTAIKIWVPELYKEYVQYIQDNDICEAEVIMPSLDILHDCPSLRYLKVCPSISSSDFFDFSPLYERTINFLHCSNRYGDRMNKIGKIDFSRICGLESLSLEVNKGTVNFNTIDTLKSLDVGSYSSASGDISDLFCSNRLDTLSIIGSTINSLEGIDKSPHLQYLTLIRNRNLYDLSALKRVSNSLKTLCIHYCPKIKDYSVISELDQLEKLELRGIKSIPSLKFINHMPSLKTLVFDAVIEDGDLTPCLNLQYVYTSTQKKHYSISIDQLPKGFYVRGNESIDEWRRLE